MIDLFDPFYTARLRTLRSNNWEKESDLASQLGLRQQEVSHLLNGSQHFTDEIIRKICRHYNIAVAEFKKLEYTENVMAFVKQLCNDAGGMPFNDQSGKIKELQIENCILRKENVNLATENSSLNWEAKKAKRAAEIVA